jgi:hypothetical protein
MERLDALRVSLPSIDHRESFLKRRNRKTLTARSAPKFHATQLEAACWGETMQPHAEPYEGVQGVANRTQVIEIAILF